MAPPLGNLFLLFDLDPGVDEAETVEAAIERKRALWSKALDDRSRHMMMRISDMQAALLDPDKRGVYRAYALAERARLADKAREQLTALVETLAQSMRDGAAVLPAEIHRIAEVVKPIPAAQVRDALQAAGVRCLESGARPDTTRKVNFGHIDELLDLLGKRDLYEMLALPPSASLRDVVAKADAEYTRVDSKPAKNVEKQLIQKLVREVKVVFKSDAERQVYDRHLADQELQALDSHIELLGRRERCITADQFDLLKARGARLGADARAVESYILRYCEAEDLLVYDRASAARRGPPAQVFCGQCGTPARSPDDLHCRQCGRALHVNCFSCRRSVYAMDMACAACGFVFTDARPLEAKLAAARAAAAAGDFDCSARLLREVLTQWPQHEPALEALAQATTQAHQAAAAALDIESALAQHRLHAAGQALAQAVARFGAGAFEAQQLRLHTAQKRAAEAIRRGSEALLFGRVDEAEAHFSAALDVAADSPDVKARLDAIPVDAPRQFKVVRQGLQVRLRWEAGPPATRYRVMRRIGFPVAADDPSPLVELTETEWIDPNPPRGLPIHYAVAALRRGVHSPQVSASAVLVPDAPTDFSAVAGDRCVHLTWYLPRAATGVELRAAPHSGVEERWQLTADHFVHQGLVNGDAVDYFLVATFHDPAGGICASAPVRASATPSVPLEPIRQLSASREGAAVVFNWQPPPAGRAEIRLLQSPLGQSFGARVSAAQLAKVGRALPLQSLSSGSGRSTLSSFQGELAHFVAVTVDASSATIGATTSLLMLEPIRNLSTSLSGRHIIVKWTWPAVGDQVQVAWRHDRAPESPTDPKAIVQTVSRAEYERLGAFRIASEAERLHHIAVWVRGSSAGNWSDGVKTRNAMGAATEVGYRVRKPLLSARRIVELQGPQDTVLTNVEIYGRESGPPMSPSDGMLIARAASVTLSGGRCEIDVSAGVAGHFVKVFCDEPENFRLSSLDKGGSRL